MSAEPERFVCLANANCAARPRDCVLLYKPGYAVRTTRRQVSCLFAHTAIHFLFRE